ncbi:MAG TPA: CocE/NonD family hydrolase [Fuerstia sp.]|nr:CocE/NonD family hydrolase [Fuerstiella sp.]
MRYSFGSDHCEESSQAIRLHVASTQSTMTQPCRINPGSSKGNVMPFGLRNSLLLALAAVYVAPITPVCAQQKAYVFEANVMMTMRDGTELAANIFKPKGDGPFPTILSRTPYGKGSEKHGRGRAYARQGYAMVIQDCRGRGDSKGLWDPFRYDAEDGFDTQEWVGQQPWCNGKIGTAGGSYTGWTQWAAAPQGSQYLKAMVPIVPFCNAYDNAYDGGAFQLALMMGWGAAVGGARVPPDKSLEAFRYLPLNRFDDQLDKEVFYLEDWVKHTVDDDYWKLRGIGREAFDDVTVPVLNIGGWYDIFSKVTLEMTNRVRSESNNRAVRRNQFAVIGPWAHGVGGSKVGDLDFGPDATMNIGQLQKKWFDYWLRDQDTGVEEWPTFQIFVMGENKWRGESEWPLTRTQYTPFYLQSNGNAADITGDGVLNNAKPGTSAIDTYTYDPDNPTPTAGGNNLGGAPAGPFDQTRIEQREDVLVYTSAPLAEAIEVTGPVKMILYAASSATDTDFTAKLVDVHPDGKAYNLCDGIIRARWRNSRTKPDLIQPGKSYRYEIDLWVTSNLFKPGHSIRVEISSSNFPRFDRNPNSGLPFGLDTKLLTATQKVFHGADQASHILLPVIPR